MKNFKIYLSIFLLFIIISAFAFLNHTEIKKESETKIFEPIITNEEKNTEILTEEPLNEPANTKTNEMEKYIIKTENEACVLITKFENGQETKSPMPDVNANYLTEIDREQLKKGIELNTKEELYKLIEDYSS